MGLFRHDNIEFYFEEYGEGSPFVFSHGLGGNLAQMRELIGDLPDVRLILYDNRGHGRTSQTGDPARLNFSVMADDMAALLDWLAIPTAIVGGVSMGAGIVLAFCMQHAGRARALVLSRPAWLNVPNPPNLSVLFEIANLVEELGRGRAWQSFERSDSYKFFEKTFPETAKSLRALFLDRSEEAIATTLRYLPASAPFQSFEELKEIRVPTLILVNHNDPLHPFEYGERIAAAIPGAQLRRFPSKSENLQEHYCAFRRLVAEFQDSLTKQSLLEEEMSRTDEDSPSLSGAGQS